MVAVSTSVTCNVTSVTTPVGRSFLRVCPISPYPMRYKGVVTPPIGGCNTRNVWGVSGGVVGGASSGRVTCNVTCNGCNGRGEAG
jgi:hypothetical protein